MLARIESGFGERLRHLDDSYSSMRDRLERNPGRGAEIAEAKVELKAEERQLQEKLTERNKLIEQLATKAQMQEGEKQEFLKKLREREKDLETARDEIQFLQSRLRRAAAQPDANTHIPPVRPSMQRYILQHVIPRIGVHYILEAPTLLLRKRFSKYAEEFHQEFIADMKKDGFCTEDLDLTAKGIQALRYVIRRRRTLGEEDLA